MTIPAKILRGQIMAGTTTANTDVSTEVSQVTITLMRDAVDVPATFGTDKQTLAGALDKECTITYYTSKMSGASAGATASASVLGGLIWTAILAGNNLKVSAVLHSGTAVSATNPRYTFDIVPLETSRGGEVGTFGQHSATYKIVGDITEAVV